MEQEVLSILGQILEIVRAVVHGPDPLNRKQSAAVESAKLIMKSSAKPVGVVKRGRPKGSGASAEPRVDPSGHENTRICTMCAKKKGASAFRIGEDVCRKCAGEAKR